MKVTQIFLGLILFFYLNMQAQDPWFHYNWSIGNRTQYRDAYNSANTFIRNVYKDNMYIGQLTGKFAKVSALSIYDDLINGNVYPTLNGYESYIKKVFNEVVKDSVLAKQIKVVFLRGTDFNAFINSAGLLQINIGLMAFLNNEAELALLLAHEAGHFVNQDAVKNFGRYMDGKYVTKSDLPFTPVPGLGKAFYYFNATRKGYWYSQEQESAADVYATKKLAQSSYSIRASMGLFRFMKRDEIRKQLKYGKSSEDFVTHPDPGDRMNLLKESLVETSQKGAQRFIIDSVSFFKLKALCYQECVNQQLLNNDLSDLVSISFSRYLLNPEDPFNLALLTEALRRILVAGKTEEIYNKPFILAAYQTPFAAASANYNYLNKKDVSILDHLGSGLIDFWKEDMTAIRAGDLLDPTRKEFTTYMEAYQYFKEKAQASGDMQIRHFNFFGEAADLKGVNEFLEKNSLFETKEYLQRSNAPGENKSMFILLPPDASDLSYLMEEMDLDRYQETNSFFLSTTKKYLGENVFLSSDFDLPQRHLISAIHRFCSIHANPLPGPLPERMNWPEQAPELYRFFTENHISQVFLCKVFPGTREAKLTYYKMSLYTKNSLSSTLAVKTAHFEMNTGQGDYIEFERAAKSFSSFCKSFL